MSFSCFLFGHNGFAPTGHTFKVLNYNTGEYDFQCVKCHRIIKKTNKVITDTIKKTEESHLVNIAWLSLITHFPQSYSGENKHSIIYNWDGSIVFRVDLEAEEMARLRD